MKYDIVAPGVKYIGVDDLDIDLFEGQYDVPEGISYNSYLIEDEKIAIMDTVDVRKKDEWEKVLEKALNGKAPDYLVVQHFEPDHSGSVKFIMEKYPNVIAVCSPKAKPMFERFFDVDYGARIQVVKEGETLSLGEHTLQFVMAPMVHWPEVMVSYEHKTKILFAADGFGKFGALCKEEENEEGWACEARRYYFNIVGKYGAMVQQLLKKAAGLDIQTICPLHGPILTENLSYYIGLYDTWSKYEPEEEGIFIAYCSFYGNTAKAALALADIIREKGNVKVSTSDIAREDLHEAVEDAFRYDRLVLCAPSYDGGVMPVMDDYINHLRMKTYQNRKVAFVENGTWAPSAGKKMREAMEAMKNITIVEPIVTVESAVKAKTIEDLKVLADALIG
ncbi:MAG: FprA family A-type flavoprotein [Bacteroidaceae bacterium]|nr:FprA family A-type flavoprotein [Bacteroidaceae bacterium]